MVVETRQEVELKALEVSTRSTLLSVIDELDEREDVDGLEVAVLTGLLRDLKVKASAFEQASTTLHAHYISKNYVPEAKLVKKNRRALIYREVTALFDTYNAQIRDSGGDIVSNFGTPSISTVAPPVSNAAADAAPGSPAQYRPVSAARADHLDDDLGLGATAADMHLARDSAASAERAPVEPVLHNIVQVKTETAYESLDPVSRHQARLDLLRGQGEPFDGNAQRFWTWKTVMIQRLRTAEATALDSLHMLIANTKGIPKDALGDLLDAGAHQPRETLDEAWDMLTRRFGDEIVVSESLKNKLAAFTPIRDSHKINELERILNLCKVIETNMLYCHELSSFNLQEGMKKVWLKLPINFQDRWQKELHLQKIRTGAFPRFDHFVRFLKSYVTEKSLPMFNTCNENISSNNSTTAKSLVTDRQSGNAVHCAYHNSQDHATLDCASVNGLSYEDCKQMAIDQRLCFNCLGNHRKTLCPRNVQCTKCNGKHTVLMHRERQVYGTENSHPMSPVDDRDSNSPSTSGGS